MGGSLGQLTSRQLERLKSELAEVIIAHFCYPAFLDYRLNMLRTRPVDRRKRQEVWAYVSSVNFNSLGSMDPASMDFRRFVERIFLRYLDVNRSLIALASARQVAAVRARVPQLAAGVARGLADYLVLGEASAFGRARPVESWGATRDGFHEPTWEQIEKSTQVLQTTLVYLRTAGTGEMHLNGAALPDVSELPTRVLTPLDVDHRLASAGATNGAAHRFQGPSRLPSISRPVDRAFIARSTRPIGGAPAAPVQPPPVPVQPPPAPLPVPPAQPEASPDAWQSLLLPGEAEQPAASTEQRAASEDAGTAPTLPDLPDLDFPDLPASFATPRQLDLPPDLAELYGDYLRDSRAASLDLSADAQNSASANGQPAPPPSETDEEVDALFNALTSHIAAQEQSARAAPQQNTGASGPVNTDPPRTVSPQQSGPLSAERESDAPRASQPLAGPREEQRPPAAPAKGMTDGDVMIFSQLQHQISTWVKMAAVSHQIDLVGKDAAELVAELRRTAALEEAELQVIEALVALCHRVTSTKQATMEDYKQAMMLYLLHHRSRLAL